MKNEISKTTQTLINEIRESLSSARQNLKRAGELLVKMLEADENAFEILIREKVASLPTLEALEKIGRGELLEKLLTDSSPAAQRAVSQGLPMRDQKRLAESAVPVVVTDGTGGTRVEYKRMDEINHREAPRVIGDGKLRSVEEQTSILKEQEVARAQRSFRYTIDGDRVVFHGEVSLTWKELEEIADKIRPKATDIQAEIVRRQVAK